MQTTETTDLTGNCDSGYWLTFDGAGLCTRPATQTVVVSLDSGTRTLRLCWLCAPDYRAL